MKKIEVPSPRQDSGIEQLFSSNVIYYFDGNGRSADAFSELKDECRGQTYHNWRNNTFFTFDGKSFDDYALILNPSYHPDKEFKDRSKYKPVIVTRDPQYFIKDMKAFNLNKWDQDVDDVMEQPLMFYDHKAQQIFVVVLDLKNKEVNATIKVNIQ